MSEDYHRYDPKWVLDENFKGRAWVRPKLLISDAAVHTCAIRVVVRKGLLEAWSSEFDKELTFLIALCGDCPDHVKLPGLRGRWVIFATPYC